MSKNSEPRSNTISDKEWERLNRAGGASDSYHDVQHAQSRNAQRGEGRRN